MGLFNFKKKKRKEIPCGCSCCAKPVEENQVVQGDEEQQEEAIARKDVETEQADTEYEEPKDGDTE